MHKIYELEDIIEKEIDQIIAQGCVKPDQWKNLGEAVDIAKDISTIKAMEGGSYDEGGSYGSYGRPDMRTPRYTGGGRMSYDGDMVDSRGSRDNYGNSGRSYNGSYESGQNVHEAIMLMERKLDHTQDPKQREALMTTIEMMRRQ